MKRFTDSPRNYRIIPTLLLAIFCMTTFFAFIPKAEAADTDVIGGHSAWADEELQRACNENLIPSKLYYSNLKQPVTRSEFSSITVRLIEEATGETLPIGPLDVFYDTRDGDSLKLSNLGIINGFPDGSFRPDAKLTRQQSARILTDCAINLIGIKSFDIKVPSEYVFADDDQIGEWAHPDVYFMTGNGILKGVGNNTFNPQGSTTREQAIIIALRTYSNYTHMDRLSWLSNIKYKNFE